VTSEWWGASRAFDAAFEFGRRDKLPRDTLSEVDMFVTKALKPKRRTVMAVSGVVLLLWAGTACVPRIVAQANKAAAPKELPMRPKLVVMLVVDQMRGDYVDKFRRQWTGGLKRLVEEGAWFPDAAYPYAATETCVGHATISTGALPAMHGMVSNAWWEREQQKGVTCTSDPNVKNTGYAGASVKGGDSAWRMLMPAFAEELKFQGSGGTRVVTFSLKARAAITMAGHQADAVTWFDPAVGAWTTSSAYPMAAFVEEYAKTHPVSRDYGKTWTPLLPSSAYWYGETATGAVPPAGFGLAFPHPLRGQPDSKGADATFYSQWQASPYAETYLAQMAEDAVDKLGLGKSAGTDYLGVSFSSVDYVGHAFGPRSWEVQDELARLDRDLASFFAHLDKVVGRGNYVVALSADHGAAPIPEDLQKTGADAGWLNVEEVKQRIEKALDGLSYAKPAVAEVGGGDVYFTPGTYEKLKTDAAAMHAVIEAIESVPGVVGVYRAEELEGRPATENPIRRAEAASFLKSRSGDLMIVPKPNWPWDFSTAGRPRQYGATHGTPYYYDQRVPVLLMGFGIRPGVYHGTITPADIAPTLASICGITLAPRDGRVLGEALAKTDERRTTRKSSAPGSAESAKP
jgi:predicted AlkP superfamily pyrophosphatase or phosphodiesterase